jgi:hypothetical protein
MKQEILILRDEVQEIVKVLEKFPGATYVEIEKDSTSGIGYKLKAAVPLEVEGTKGTFSTYITDERSW